MGNLANSQRGNRSISKTERFPAPSLSVVNELMPVIERFVTLMYDRTSACTSANEARKDLFKGRTINYAISPTADALIRRLKRSVYQGGLIRGEILGVNV